jgi:hypothetical protein
MSKILLLVLLVYAATGCKNNVTASNPVTLGASATFTDSADGLVHYNNQAVGAVFTFDGPASFSATSDASGAVSIPNAPAGTYTITVSLDGYGTQKIFNFPFNISNVAYAVLYPKFDYQEHITDIHTEDTIRQHPIRVGVVVGANGDTLDQGHIEFGTPDTAKAWKIVVSGTYSKPAYEQFPYFLAYGYLLIGKTKDISPFDPNSWSLSINNNSNYRTDEVTIGDSTFSFTIFDSYVNILHKDFKKGDNLYLAAYISPFNSIPQSGTSGGIGGQSAHYLPPNSNNLVFPCFHSGRDIKSTVLPW